MILSFWRNWIEIAYNFCFIGLVLTQNHFFSTREATRREKHKTDLGGNDFFGRTCPFFTVVSNMFYLHPLFGEMIQFDKHILFG